MTQNDVKRKKTDKELVDEWLKNNKPEIIPTVSKKDYYQKISQVKMNASNIITLGEAMDTFGEKQKRTSVKIKKSKTIDIDKNLIPESLHSIIGLFNKKDGE